MKWKERAKQLKTDIPALYLALQRKETPLGAKILAGIAVGYALSPVDLIPDFIPVLGLLDDLIILPALVVLVVRLVPCTVMAECRQQAKDMWVNGNPKKWYYALPVVLVWLLVVFVVVKWVWF